MHNDSKDYRDNIEAPIKEKEEDREFEKREIEED